LNNSRKKIKYVSTCVWNVYKVCAAI
jgi:hypothetical protein